MTIDRNELIKKIEDCHELEELGIELSIAEDCGEDTQTIRKEGDKLNIELRRYFSKIALDLHRLGVFATKEEAKEVINIDPDNRWSEVGPKGVPPDDGALNPEEDADGILELFEWKGYEFQVPISLAFGNFEIDMEVPGQFQIQVKASVLNFSLLADDPSSQEFELDKWAWMTGKVYAYRYSIAVKNIEILAQQVSGALLAMGILNYSKHRTKEVPQRVVGRAGVFNVGKYVGSIRERIAGHLVPHSPPSLQVGDCALDRIEARQHTELGNVYERQLRLVRRAFSTPSPDAPAVRHACRMFLRSFDSWGSGEMAMFLCTALEGLLLSKKNRDDLSSRLQDSVAYWLGGPASEREKIRKQVNKMYIARSQFVHNGELDQQKFSVDAAIKLTRKVLEKELQELG